MLLVSSKSNLTPGNEKVPLGSYNTVTMTFSFQVINYILYSGLIFSGLVRSNPMLTLVQISSRVAVLWTVVHKIDIVQTSIGLPLMLFAWTLTEIIRYSYYILNLVRNFLVK